VPPAKLAGLGYLPRGTNVLFGLHIREAMQDPLSREFLARLRQGTTGFGLDSVEKWTGLKRDEIDHAILGLKVEDRLPPRLALVVRTRQPYSTDQVRATLKAERRTEREKKTLYRFPMGQLDGVIWFAGDQTIVVGLTVGDLDEVPLTPAEGLDHLPPALTQLMEERLTPGTQVWAVGHADDWEKTVARFLLVTLPKEDQAGVAAVQSFGLWLQFDRGMTLNAAFRCATAERAE
jgi:hypothetical protein